MNAPTQKEDNTSKIYKSPLTLVSGLFSSPQSAQTSPSFVDRVVLKILILILLEPSQKESFVNNTHQKEGEIQKKTLHL